VAGVLIRMKLRLIRNQMTGLRGLRMAVGALLGVLGVLLTVRLVTTWPDRPQLAALAFALWTAGWLAAPFFGGGTEETLRPEYFRMAPVPARRLAGGLLAGAAVSVPALATLVAFATLVPMAVPYGAGAVAVAVPAALLHMLMALLVARVVIDGLGAALRSRLGMDILTMIVSVVVAGGIVAILALARPLWDMVSVLARGDLPEFSAPWLLGLPSGWGVVAVRSAGEGGWGMALAALAGLAALDAVLLAAWTALLRRRLIAVAPSRRSRGKSAGDRAARPLAATPVGASTVRGVRTWLRDHEMRIVVVVTVAAGIGYGLVGGFLWPYFMPLAGVLALSVACSESANLFGFDGSAHWLTLTTPDSERAEVRGRQIAWLAIFAPIGVAVSAVVIPTAGPDVQVAIPYAVALLPAMLGVGSGLVVLFSVIAPYPVGLDSPVPGSGKSLAPPVRRLILLAQAAGLAPTAGVVALGTLAGSPLVQWGGGILAGVATGCLGAWLLGKIAYERLRQSGPELLQVLKPV
jgi:ABC-2 type transport system permease protein